MSEEQMNDSTFGRLFIIMIIAMTVLTAVIMVLASFASSDVNARLDEQYEQESTQSIADRIAPVGGFSTEGTAAPVPVVAKILTPEEAYSSSCAACHTAGIAGAPTSGDASLWADRIAKGIDTLYSNAINGYQGASGLMPAKGGNASLSDDAVKAAVDYMVEASK